VHAVLLVASLLCFPFICLADTLIYSGETTDYTSYSDTGLWDYVYAIDKCILVRGEEFGNFRGNTDWRSAGRLWRYETGTGLSSTHLACPARRCSVETSQEIFMSCDNFATFSNMKQSSSSGWLRTRA
jgi:hypothetical protein